jgi:hypothetical protein
MKKLLIVLAIALFGLNSIKAQEASGIIKVNPLGFAFGIFNATYEKPLSDKSSIAIGASFFNWSNLNISGMGASAEYRFYFSNNSDAPHGMFAAPIIDLASYSYEYTSLDFDTGKTTTEKETLFSFGGGVKAGHQWIWDSGIALDLYFGYGFRGAKFKNYDFSGGYPILGLAIGYAFQ